MIISNKDIVAIEEKLKPLLGKKTWGVHRQRGSFIDFQFNNLTTIDEDYNRGEWLLSVMHCAWRLQTTDEVIIGSWDEQTKIDSELKRLENIALTSVEVTPPSLETTISFEGGLILRLFPIYTYEDYRTWMLFMPSNYVLIVGPGNNWSYKRSDIPE